MVGLPIYGIFLIVLIIFFLYNAIKILNEYERGVIFRLGRVLERAKGPGLIILIPIVDKMVRVSLRTVVLDVPPQDVITKDNVTIKVNAVVYFRVMDPMKAIIDVENYLYATSQLSQTTLRSEVGKIDLDKTFEERAHINSQVVSEVDKASEAWGVKVLRYEIKNITPPRDVIAAMEKQMRAEREKRATVLQSEGERDAAINSAEGQKQQVIKQSEAKKAFQQALQLNVNHLWAQTMLAEMK